MPVPNQFGPLIKVVARVVEEDFFKSCYLSQILLILKSLEKLLLTKVVGVAVIFNPKKSLEKLLLTKAVGVAVIFNPKKSLEKLLLTKVVGMADIFNPKKSLEKLLLPKVVGMAVILKRRLTWVKNPAPSIGRISSHLT